jgi:hypothetical protein
VTVRASGKSAGTVDENATGSANFLWTSFCARELATYCRFLGMIKKSFAKSDNSFGEALAPAAMTV